MNQVSGQVCRSRLMVTKRVDHFGPDSSGSKESCIRRGQDRTNLLASERNDKLSSNLLAVTVTSTRNRKNHSLGIKHTDKH